MYLNKKDHSLGEVQSAIANFVCMLTFIYETDISKPHRVPLIIKHCLDVLNLTNSKNFNNWFRSQYPLKRWIPHTLLSLTHNIIRNHVEIARNPEHKHNILHNSITSEPIELLEQSISAYAHIKHCITSAVTYGTGDFYWSTAPPSWAGFKQQQLAAMSTQHRNTTAGDFTCPPDRAANTSNSNNRNAKKHDYKKYGWLTSTAPISTWPPALNRICPHFIFVNSVCPNKRNCSKAHVFYCDLTEAEKDAAEAFVRTTQDLFFNLDKKTYGKHAVPKRMRRNSP